MNKARTPPAPLLDEASVATAKQLAELAAAAAQLSGESFGLGAVAGPEDDPEAPRLPLAPDEPAPVSSLDPALMHATPKVRARPPADAVKENLLRALASDSYDPKLLPDSRAMLLTILRLLVQSGVDADTLAEAILATARE